MAGGGIVVKQINFIDQATHQQTTKDLPTSIFEYREFASVLQGMVWVEKLNSKSNNREEHF